MIYSYEFAPALYILFRDVAENSIKGTFYVARRNALLSMGEGLTLAGRAFSAFYCVS